MSIATQVERLQNVRNQIRARMVKLGLSVEKNEDLLQTLATSLDTVDKIAPSKSDTDPGESYTQVETLGRSTSDRYIKVPRGYNDANRKFKISGVKNGSVAEVSGNPGIADPAPVVVDPSGTSKKYVKISEGYLLDRQITVNEMKGGSITKVTDDPGTDYPDAISSITPSTDKQYVKVSNGYLPNKRIVVDAIPSPYFNTSKVTATSGTVLKDYKFVDSEGATITGTIATATSANVSGKVSANDPTEIVLNTGTTSSSSSTTATATATVTKNLYTGSADISKDLESKSITAKAKATLASSVTGSETVPTTLPTGAVSITPSTDNKKRIYSDTANNGFITKVVVNSMSSATLSTSGSAEMTVPPEATGGIKGSLTYKLSSTEPSGTDGTDFYTLIPSIADTVAAKATASATTTVTASGHLAKDTTSTKDNIVATADVTKHDGTTVYLSATTYTDKGTTDPGTSYTNKLTISPSGTDPKYVQITEGYTPNSKITISKMSAGSVSEATTTDPGTSYPNAIDAITPSTSIQYVKVSAGYLPNCKIKVNTIPSTTVTLKASSWTAITTSPELGGYTLSVTVTGVTTSSHVIVYPDDTAAAKTYGVYAYSQAKNSLTFRAFDKPTADMKYKVYYFS